MFSCLDLACAAYARMRLVPIEGPPLLATLDAQPGPNPAHDPLAIQQLNCLLVNETYLIRNPLGREIARPPLAR